MTPAEFRQMALSLPDVTEGSHMGHADFRVGGKIFATLGYPSDRFGVIMLSPQDQDLIVRDYPKAFAPVAGSGARPAARPSPCARRASAPSRSRSKPHGESAHRSGWPPHSTSKERRGATW